MGKYYGDDHTQDENDNHSDQMNPNNDTYWSDRDEGDCPEDQEDERGE